MATKSIKIFFALSIIFYILLASYLWYAVYTVRSAEFDAAAESAAWVNSEIDGAYSIDYSVSSEYFTDKITGIFQTHPELSGLILADESDKLQYVKLTDSRIVRSLGENFNPETPLPVISPVHPFMKVFNTRLYLSDGNTLSSVVVFDLLDRSLFFPILRNCLIAALIYLVLTIIVMSTQSAQKPQPVSVVDEKTAEDSTPTDEFDLEDDFNAEIEKLPNTLPEIDDEQPPLNPASNSLSGLYSERSGLVWEHFLKEKLEAELKRAASFDQDSCLVFLSVVSSSGFIPYRNISELIIEHFSYKDLAFESGDNTFCVIIPEKDIDEGQIEVEKFKKSLLSRFPDSSYRIYAGLTSRNSRLLTEKRMIQEAKAALKKAEEEDVSTTISFRTDLNKYREYIASTV